MSKLIHSVLNKSSVSKPDEVSVAMCGLFFIVVAAVPYALSL